MDKRQLYLFHQTKYISVSNEKNPLSYNQPNWVDWVRHGWVKGGLAAPAQLKPTVSMFAAGFFSDLQGVGKVLKPILTQFFKVGEADLELIFGRGVLNNPPSLIGLNALPPCRVNLQLTTKYHRIT